MFDIHGGLGLNFTNCGELNTAHNMVWSSYVLEFVPHYDSATALCKKGYCRARVLGLTQSLALKPGSSNTKQLAASLDKMLLNLKVTVILSSFFTSTLAEESQLWARSIPNSAALSKRSGYNPLYDLCGTGTSCSEACGRTFIQCDANDGNLHCFDPNSKQTCCPNGSGRTYFSLV